MKGISQKTKYKPATSFIAYFFRPTAFNTQARFIVSGLLVKLTNQIFHYTRCYAEVHSKLVVPISD